MPPKIIHVFLREREVPFLDSSSEGKLLEESESIVLAKDCSGHYTSIQQAVNAPAKPPPRNKRESCNIRQRNVMVIGNGVDSTISPV